MTHHGIVLVLRNLDRTAFILQKKDDSYPRFPLCYSFFGGAMELGETPKDALLRELYEELSEQALMLLSEDFKEVFSGMVQKGQDSFRLTMFEQVLDEEALKEFACLPVKEGLCAELISRDQLPKLSFAWGLETMVPIIAGA
jgi:8-oxo-dGTP pyrophosphatase MutT (NUDIX family)